MRNVTKIGGAALALAAALAAAGCHRVQGVRVANRYPRAAAIFDEGRGWPPDQVGLIQPGRSDTVYLLRTRRADYRILITDVAGRVLGEVRQSRRAVESESADNVWPLTIGPREALVVRAPVATVPRGWVRSGALELRSR